MKKWYQTIQSRDRGTEGQKGCKSLAGRWIILGINELGLRPSGETKRWRRRVQSREWEGHQPPIWGAKIPGRPLPASSGDAPPICSNLWRDGIANRSMVARLPTRIQPSGRFSASLNFSQRQPEWIIYRSMAFGRRRDPAGDSGKMLLLTALGLRHCRGTTTACLLINGTCTATSDLVYSLWLRNSRRWQQKPSDDSNREECDDS
jgi:hypothetical protein